MIIVSTQNVVLSDPNPQNFTDFPVISAENKISVNSVLTYKANINVKA